MIWVPIGAWLGAMVLAVVVLGFLAYEITWKLARLRTEVTRLDALEQRLGELQRQVSAAGERLASAESSARVR